MVIKWKWDFRSHLCRDMTGAHVRRFGNWDTRGCRLSGEGGNRGRILWGCMRRGPSTRQRLPEKAGLLAPGWETISNLQNCGKIQFCCVGYRSGCICNGSPCIQYTLRQHRDKWHLHSWPFSLPSVNIFIPRFYFSDTVLKTVSLLKGWIEIRV